MVGCRVSSSGYQHVGLQLIRDARGSLLIAEAQRHIPFAVKRVFAIYDVTEGASRGGHAHRTQEQFLMIVAGDCTATIDDGRSRAVVQLKRGSEGLYVPARHWLELAQFSAGAVCVVLASGPYDEADYIRDYDGFLAAL
jgi:hypothetical protein